jgi:hypothetical protein
VLPADQRLGADRPPAAQAHHRLVVDAELAALHGAVQGAVQGQPALGARPHAAVEHDTRLGRPVRASWAAWWASRACARLRSMAMSARSAAAANSRVSLSAAARDRSKYTVTVPSTWLDSAAMIGMAQAARNPRASAACRLEAHSGSEATSATSTGVRRCTAVPLDPARGPTTRPSASCRPASTRLGAAATRKRAAERRSACSARSSSSCLVTSREVSTSRRGRPSPAGTRA